MATSKTTTYSWLFLLVVIVGGIAFIVGVLMPAWGEIKNSKQELVNALSKLEQKKNTLKIIETVRKEYDENFTKVQRLEMALPQEEDIPGLIVQMRDIAIEAGVGVKSASFQSSQKIKKVERTTMVEEAAISGGVGGAPGAGTGQAQEAFLPEYDLGEVPISLSAEGSYDNLKKFLDVVGSNLRLLEISSLAFSGKGGNFNMSLQVKAYVLNK